MAYDTDPNAKMTARRKKCHRVFGNPLTQLLLAFIVISLVQGLLVKVYTVPSESMQSTLEVGDRILVNRTAFVFSEPQAGEVVVFNTPESWHGEPAVVIDSPLEYVVRLFGQITGIGPGMHAAMVKRIVATPGQTVACCGPDGRIMVDGVPLDVPRTGIDFPGTFGATADGSIPDCSSEADAQGCFEAFTVPEDEYVLLGDNRPGSSDSLSTCQNVPAGTAGVDCVRTVHRDDIVGAVFAVAFPNTRGVE